MVKSRRAGGETGRDAGLRRGGETEVTLNRASFAELQAVVGGKTGAERILGRGLIWERLDSEPSGRGLDIVALSEALSPFAFSAEAVIRREELAAVGPMRLDSESYIKVCFCWCEAWWHRRCTGSSTWWHKFLEPQAGDRTKLTALMGTQGTSAEPMRQLALKAGRRRVFAVLACAIASHTVHTFGSEPRPVPCLWRRPCNGVRLPGGSGGVRTRWALSRTL